MNQKVSILYQMLSTTHTRFFEGLLSAKSGRVSYETVPADRRPPWLTGFNVCTVSEAINSAKRCILGVYPLFMDAELDGIQSLLDNVDRETMLLTNGSQLGQPGRRPTPGQKAVAMLLYAVGSTCFALHMPRVNCRRIPGQRCYIQAAELMAQDNPNGEDFVRNRIHANILRSIYHGLLGDADESWSSNHAAAKQLQRISPDYLRAFSEHGATISVEANRLFFAYWICVMIERCDDPSSSGRTPLLTPVRRRSELTPKTGERRVLLKDSNLNVPYPDFELAAKQGLDPAVAQNFQAAVWLHRQKMTMKTDCPDMNPVEHAKLTEPLFFLPEADIPRFLPNGRQPSNFMEARLRAVYWHTKAHVYKPSIYAVLQQPASTMEEPVKKYAKLGIEAYMESLEALASFSVPIIVPNLLSLLER